MLIEQVEVRNLDPLAGKKNRSYYTSQFSILLTLNQCIGNGIETLAVNVLKMLGNGSEALAATLATNVLQANEKIIIAIISSSTTMAPYQHAMSFTVAAIGMACIWSLAAATREIYPPGPSNVVTIQNSFHTTNLTVQCHSDTELVLRNVTHIVLPKKAYMFPFDPKVHHRWICTLRTEKKGVLCSRAKSGEFTMWEKRIPPMCDRNCPWFAGPDGLSLVEHQGAKPVHVYNWPSDKNGTMLNC
jgi:hypothetical protein